MQHLTNEDFSQKTAQGIIVVDFYATRCGPCKMIAPYLEQLAEQHAGKVSFYKVDVDAQPYLSASQGIRAMPTLKVFHNSKNVETIVGADLEKLIATVDTLVKAQAETKSTEYKTGNVSGAAETQEQAKKVTIPLKKTNG